MRTVAQHDSAPCLDWTPARSCQKPGLEGTHPSWSNNSEMWHKQAAMAGEVCVVYATMVVKERVHPQTQTRCGHCTTAWGMQHVVDKQWLKYASKTLVCMTSGREQLCSVLNALGCETRNAHVNALVAALWLPQG